MNRRLVAIGALATLTSGCSLVMVKGPPGYIPANDPVPAGACTSGMTIPLIDAVGAVAGVATALTNSEGDAVRFGAVAGGALGFSSYTGFRRVGACRKRISPAPQGQGFALPAGTVPGGQPGTPGRSPVCGPVSSSMHRGSGRSRRPRFGARIRDS